MPYIKIWIHLVWATKNRAKVLKKEIRQTVFEHLKENAKVKNIHIDHINGHLDHVHCLVSMNADQNIATISQLLKGESSFWINKEKLCKSKFAWQSEYFAVSIGHSQVETVREYIRNQEEHHKKHTFQEEYKQFIEKYGFQVFQDD